MPQYLYGYALKRTSGNLPSNTFLMLELGFLNAFEKLCYNLGVNLILENKMGKYDAQLQAVERDMNDNVERLRELLDALPIIDLYRETDDVRQLHNQQVEEYNHRLKRTFPVAPELNEELTKAELMQRFIKLYTEGNQLAIVIKTSKQSEKAMEEYLRVTGKKPAAKEVGKAADDTPSHNIGWTPFQRQISTLCQEYGQLFETKQTIMVAKKLEEEKEEALKKYNELKSHRR